MPVTLGKTHHKSPELGSHRKHFCSPHFLHSLMRQQLANLTQSSLWEEVPLTWSLSFPPHWTGMFIICSFQCAFLRVQIHTYPKSWGKQISQLVLEQHLVQLLTLVCGQQQRCCTLAKKQNKQPTTFWWKGYGSEEMLVTNTFCLKNEGLICLKNRSFLTPSCFQMLHVAALHFSS